MLEARIRMYSEYSETSPDFKSLGDTGLARGVAARR